MISSVVKPPKGGFFVPASLPLALSPYSFPSERYLVRQASLRVGALSILIFNNDGCTRYIKPSKEIISKYLLIDSVDNMKKAVKCGYFCVLLACLNLIIFMRILI